MTHDSDFFTPEDVDAQVEQLSQHSMRMRGHLPDNERAGEPSETGAALMRDLKAYYGAEQQEDSASLERAWKRVSVRLPGEYALTQLTTRPLSTPTGMLQERILIMQNHISGISSKGKLSRWLGLLVAVLVAALLVGSLIAVLNLSRHQGTTTGGSGVQATHATHVPTTTSTPAPVPGKTLYTTPTNNWGFESLSWSPNSKRVASSTVDPQGVQLWDATTGGHLVTVQMPGGADEWASGLSWSPTSEDVAVVTNQHLLLVNGQTGNVVNSHLAGAPIASNMTSSGQTRFSSLFAASGGLGYRAIAWSPDGHLLAAGFSFGINGEVQVWNPQTGTTDFTISAGDTDNIGALAWSPDGQYIAASTWNTQGVSTGKVVVWNVTTHQTVFQHSSSLSSSDAPLAWQPKTHNLAFVGVTGSGSNQVATLEIWDASAGKLVKQYVGAGSGALAWSPDGTDLAYANFKKVIIMDVTSGKQIFVYKEHDLPVSIIAWSPDGKYVASAEGNTMGKMVAKVWTA